MPFFPFSYSFRDFPADSLSLDRSIYTATRNTFFCFGGRWRLSSTLIVFTIEIVVKFSPSKGSMGENWKTSHPRTVSSYISDDAYLRDIKWESNYAPYYRLQGFYYCTCHQASHLLKLPLICSHLTSPRVITPVNLCTCLMSLFFYVPEEKKNSSALWNNSNKMMMMIKGHESYLSPNNYCYSDMSEHL